MADMIKLRLHADGPEGWRFRIEDAETGKVLPVMNFTIDVRNDVVAITTTLMLSEVDVAGLVNIQDLIRQAEIDPETTDEWVARTVALVLETDS